MTRPAHAYIDVTVVDAVRPHALSPRAALVWSEGDVLWANAAGARLLGAQALRSLLEGDSAINPAIRRQIEAAAGQLDHRDEATATIRARIGFKTALVPLSLTRIQLADGEVATLAVDPTPLRRRDMNGPHAAEMVDCLDGYGHASAIVDGEGGIIAASDHYEALDLDSADLLQQLSETGGPLLKTSLRTEGGDLAIGLARLSEEPARHLLIVADGDGDGELAVEGWVPEDEREPEIEEDTGPRVGAFSNRLSRTRDIGRWYFKVPKPDEDDDDEFDIIDEATDELEAALPASDTSEDDEMPEAQVASFADIQGEPVDNETGEGEHDEEIETSDAAMLAAAKAAVEGDDRSDESEQVQTDAVEAVAEEETVQDNSVEDEVEPVIEAQTIEDDHVVDDEPATAPAPRSIAIMHRPLPTPFSPAVEEQTASLIADDTTDEEPQASELADDADEPERTDEAGLEDLAVPAVPLVPSPAQSAQFLSTGSGDDEVEQPDPIDAEEAAPESDLPEIDDGFRFAAGARPVRFTWDMDTDNTFGRVSGELASTVGPASADIAGQSWDDVSERLGFENGSVVAALLERGDTWSNRTVLWPVDGADIRVPVDLAGLPSYGAAREFKGFNGFGIIRTADAVLDDSDRDETATFVPDLPDEEVAKAEPVKALTPTKAAFFTPEPISNNDPYGELPPRPAAPEASDDDLLALGSDADETEPTFTEEDEDAADEAFGRHLSRDETKTFRRIGATLNDGTEGMDGAEDEAEPTIEVVPVADNVNVSILSQMPIPVMVYRDNSLLFANDELLQTTGYEDLHALAAAGGVGALFAEDRAADGGTIRHRDGHTLPLQAHIKHVPWDDRKAVLLTLNNRPDGPREDAPPPVETTLKAVETVEAPAAPESEPRSADRTNVTPFPRSRVRETVETPAPLSPEVAAREMLDRHKADARARMNLAAPESETVAVQEAPSTTPATTPATEPEDGPVEPFGGLEADDLRAILDVATDGVIIVSQQGMVRAINRSAEALFDMDEEAIVHRSITRLLAPESHRAALDYLSNLSADGVAAVLNDGREVMGRTAQGGLVPLFMTVGRLEHTDACCAVVRDITHWKRAEGELLTAKTEAEEASDQKTAFLARVSHEIRTPLNAIIGFSEMMIEERLGKIDNDRYRGYLRDINRSGGHVLDLVNDLLDISKIEAGKMELEFDAVDLNKAVSQSVALVQGEANSDRVLIRTSLSTVVPKVVADERSLSQIVLNLVSNAVKFTKASGQVIVSTVYEDTGEVVLRVRDTGVGMNAADLERALQPFRQASTTAANGARGTGLGLPLTKALVEANRADFHIESEEGTGTLVEVHFPVQRVLAER